MTRFEPSAVRATGPRGLACYDDGMRWLGAAFFVLLLPTAAAAQDAARAAPPASAPQEDAAEREAQKRLATLSAAERAKVAAAGRELLQRMDAPVKKGEKPKSLEEHALAAARAHGLVGLGHMSIHEILLIALQEAIRESDKDKKAILEKLKAIEAVKRCGPPQCIDALKPTADFGQAALDAVREKAKNKLDSLSEMGEMESLRLKAADDRLRRLRGEASALLRKIGR